MATIKDIAKAAGVSAMTVSRAFNSPDMVKEEVRKNILKIAKDLQYVPNQAARSLMASKSGIIQVVTGMDPSIHYFTQLFTGAAQYLSEHGLSTMISYKEKGNFQCDGVIYMGLKEEEDKQLLESENKPFVLFGKSDLSIDWVDINNVDGIYTVTKHLIENGHKNIGYIGVKDDVFNKERYMGFCKAMADFSLKIDEASVFSINHTMEDIKGIGSDILNCENITAFVCETDFIAYGLIEYCKEHGRSIPDDLSFVGFDGILHNKLSNPHITTVVQPVYEIGIELAKMLVNRINNPESSKQELLIETVFEKGESVKNLRNN